jgi:hypothetical protein
MAFVLAATCFAAFVAAAVVGVAFCGVWPVAVASA